MNRKLIRQWIPRVLVVATLAATGVVTAAEQGTPMMNERDMPTNMQPGQMGYGGMMDMMMGGGPGGGMGMMGGGMGPGMGMGPVSMLDLSDEQRDKI